MANATITRLPPYDYPMAWAMRIGKTDRATFASFIESLKYCIPSYDRRWDADSKQWFFTEDHLDSVQTLLRRHGLTFTVDNSAGATPPRQLVSKEQAAAELFLLPTAPPEIVKAVYKLLAKQYHPDMGGDLEKMQKLNAAVEVLT